MLSYFYKADADYGTRMTKAVNGNIATVKAKAAIKRLILRLVFRGQLVIRCIRKSPPKSPVKLKPFPAPLGEFYRHSLFIISFQVNEYLET